MKILYENPIKELLRKIHIIEFEQLEQYLIRGYDTSEATAKSVIYDAARSGIILLSENGYVTTKASLDIIFDDEITINFNKLFRLKELYPSPYDQRNIDCFWLVLDMLPRSEDFVITATPYNIMFIDEVKNKLIQIIRIAKDTEIPTKAMLLSQVVPDNDIKNNIRRIALVDSDVAIEYVPKVGFTEICVYDETQPLKFRVGEIRKENIWKDAN